MTSRSERVTPGPPLRGIFLAAGDVDDVDRQIGELGREGRGEIVAAGFDQNKVERGKAPAHVVDRREVDRGVLADRGVRTAAGLDAHDALGRQRAGLDQNARVLLGVDVVGDRRDVVGVATGACTIAPSAPSCRSRPGRRRRRAAACVCVMSGTTSNIAFRAASRRCRSGRRRRRDRRAALPTPARASAESCGKSPAMIFCPSVWPTSRAASRRRRDWRTWPTTNASAARLQRHAAARRRGGDGDRIGERLAVARREPRQRLAVPGGARGDAEGGALRGRLQPPLGRAGERDRQFVDGLERRASRRRAAARNAWANSDRVDARARRNRARSASQAASDSGVGDVARLDAHSSPCE